MRFPENLKDDIISQDRKMQSENTDYMRASKQLLLFWITFITPSVICYTMKWIYTGRIKNEEVFEMTKL